MRTTPSHPRGVRLAMALSVLVAATPHALAQTVDASAPAPDPDAPTIGPRLPEAPVTNETPGDTQPAVTQPAVAQPPTTVRRSTPPTNAARAATSHSRHWRPTGPPPEQMSLRGMAGAYFYRPSAGGRQRVLVYLHSRGANPREACMRWHESTPRFGWLVCPVGPYERGRGREWRNNAMYARRESIAAIEDLYRRFPRRVRRHDNVIMGFSEGAYTAMNVGLWEPLTFPRWFIIAAHDGYVDSEREAIRQNANTVRRVYLLTGQFDEIVEHTRRAYEELSRAWGRRRVRVRILEHASHELPPEFVRDTRRALLWVTADR